MNAITSNASATAAEFAPQTKEKIALRMAR
jgi:hypothetical protein